MGEELLLSAFRMADVGNIPEISALISDEMSRERFSAGAQSFFTERLFEEERSVMGNRVLTIKDLAGTPFMEQEISKFPKPRPLSDLSPIEQKAVLEKLMSLPEAESLYDPGYGRKLLDEERLLCIHGREGTLRSHSRA